MRFVSASVAITAALALAGCGYGEESMAQHLNGGAPPAAAASAPADAAALPPAPPPETRKPFIVIRFEGDHPDYARPLYDAMTNALKKKPDVAFDLVAVTRHPAEAQRNLESVFHTMMAMGLPASRITLSAAAAQDEATDEVWIYVR
jgi:hypothetical protein